jgi:WD40 repeat protein
MPNLFYLTYCGGWDQSYHQAAITGMDICLLKPFVVTCSNDSTVRVWNYVENLCEIVKIFPSEALSVSIHPTGASSYPCTSY